MRIDMKRSLVCSIFSVSILAYAATVVVPARAGDNDKFYCGKSGGVPTTMAKTSRGSVAVIRWVSKNAFREAYLTEVRCNIVSSKFQSFYQDGSLNFLTTGVINLMPVICAAQVQDGPCKGVLFTLKPSVENPGRTLTRLLDICNRESGPLLQGFAPHVYINMKEFLATAPVVSTGTERTVVAPVVQPKFNVGGGDHVWYSATRTC
jgi:Circadian oscillating protein COP23